MDLISIHNKIIGPGQPCYIIAEAGVNHNGDVQRALALIAEAAKAGADAVKFQTFSAENLVTRTAKMAGYQVKNTGEEKSQFDMLKALELPLSAYPELQSYAGSLGIDFLSTPFDETAVDFLGKLDVPLFKVGSGDMNNHPYLRKIAVWKRPVILSTGMADLDEVLESVSVLRNAGLNEIIVLQCTTNYPAQNHEINLRAMQTLHQQTGCITGFSDHTESILAAIVSVALGASVLEKHFTLDKNLPGPDHKASLEPGELKRMITQIREAETMLGDGIKKPNPSEISIREVARKSIVSARNIPAGKIITSEDIICKRPGNGIQPREWEKIIGKTAKEAIEEDCLLSWDDIS